MNLKLIRDDELVARTKNLVLEERRVTQEVLEHLHEIDSRKLYLEMGYSSLYDFCVKSLGYSEGSANRRISAMRLLRQIPQAREKLENGSVNLSTLTLLHGHIRREEKVQKLSLDEKLELLQKIENKSQDESQRELLRVSSEPARVREQAKPLTQDLTEIRFVASRELLDKLYELKGLLAHRTDHLGWGELVETLADLSLQKLDPRRRPARPTIKAEALSLDSKAATKKPVITTKNSSAATRNPLVATAVETVSLSKVTTVAAAKPSVNRSRYIPAALKKKIWQRDQGCCQYENPKTQKKCLSRYAPQVDHVVPFALGGATTEGNLRVLCRAHNSWRAEKTFGRLR